MTDVVERLNAALDGRYRIVREIGEGGMATVYLADDLRHERKVALKVLKPELAAVVGAERFLAEIKTTANLQHPHILPLFDSGEADSFLYYVMPYVEGETLQDWLDREKQLPVDEAVRIAVAVAGALAYAHEHGIVHRDIKPGNVLVQAGQPMVGDFGIALAVGAAGGARLTETGLSVGTPYYMSPEQATGDMNVGPASDIYALGAVLYELLTGDPPYMGNTAQAVLGKILQGAPVSATAVRRSIPLNVDAAIRKALEKLPADRFTSANDFGAALKDATFRHGGTVETAAARAGVWNPVSIGMSVVAVGMAALAAWALLRSEPAPPVQRFSLKVGDPAFPSEWIALSPDGSAMVSSRPDDDGSWGVWLRRFSDLREVRLPGVTQPVNDPIISPDGAEMAYFENGVLKVSPLAGGLVRTLADDANCCGRWGGDGYFYYSAQEGHIRRIPETGGSAEDVVTLAPEDAGAQMGYFHLMPGGDAAVFTVFGADARLEGIDISSGERHVITPGMRSYLTPTGHLVFAEESGRLLAAPFDADAMELSGPAVPLIEGVTIRNGDAAYSLSDSGSLLYWLGPAASTAAEFVWVARNGGVTPVDPGWTVSLGTGNFGWRISPDGGRLAYRELGGDPGEIWVKELDDGPLSRLTFDAGSDASPEWTPDGRSILFRSTRLSSGNFAIWSRRADGTGEPRLVLDPARDVAELAVSPDAEWIVFRAGDSPSRDILAQRPDDSVAVELLASPSFDEVGPAISPDGRWLAYASNETGNYQIYVRPFPDVDAGRWQVSAGGGVAPRWSHSGDELFYGTATGAFMAARLDTSSGFRVLSTETMFTDTQILGEGFTNGWYDVALDDQRFLMARPVTAGADSSEPELILVQNFFGELERLVPN